MKKTMISLLLVCVLLTLLPFGVFATEVETTAAAVVREPGQCGEDMTWSYSSGTLTISGYGDMDHYSEVDAPWLDYKDSITKIVVTGNVTSIGECAFMDYDALTEVDFGPAMHTIHYRAFKSCDSLTSITLPSTFRRFGEESFMSCKNLTEVHCNGPMPSFNGNCFWDTYCNIYYPSNNPWPAEYVQPLFQAFQGRIQFYMAGPAEVTPIETNPPATEATQPPETVPPTTEAETVPPTTEEVTVPTTAATEATEAPTEAPAETWAPEWLQETQAPEEEEARGGVSGIWFGLFLITGTLSLILIGALVFRRKSY